MSFPAAQTHPVDRRGHGFPHPQAQAESIRVVNRNTQQGTTRVFIAQEHSAPVRVVHSHHSYSRTSSIGSRLLGVIGVICVIAGLFCMAVGFDTINPPVLFLGAFLTGFGMTVLNSSVTVHRSYAHL